MRNGWQMSTMLRVYNTCKYDIGIVTSGGQPINVPGNGGMAILQIQDILLIEANHSKAAFFSSGKLMIADENNQKVSLEELGGYTITNGTNPHFTDEEIRDHLRQSAKKIGEWVSEIDDKAEQEAIFLIAKEMDLPASKIDVLAKAMPDKEWIKNPYLE